MDIKQHAITEYLTIGTGYRQLAAKYGVGRTTICKWVQIHQGIHNIPPTEKQQKYYLSGMNSKPDNTSSEIVVFWSEKVKPNEYLGYRVSTVNGQKRDAEDIPPEEIANAVKEILSLHITAE